MIGIIIFCVIVLILLSVAIILNEKNGEDVNTNKGVDVSNSSEHLSPKRLTLKMISILKSLEYNKAIYFDGFCVSSMFLDSKSVIGSDMADFNGDMFLYFDSYYMDVNVLRLLELHYPSIEEDKRVEHFIERLVSLGTVKEDPYHTLEKLLKPFIGERTYRGKQWLVLAMENIMLIVITQCTDSLIGKVLARSKL